MNLILFIAMSILLHNFIQISSVLVRFIGVVHSQGVRFINCFLFILSLPSGFVFSNFKVGVIIVLSLIGNLTLYYLGPVGLVSLLYSLFHFKDVSLVLQLVTFLLVVLTFINTHYLKFYLLTKLVFLFTSKNIIS